MLRNVCACVGFVILVLVLIILVRTATFSVRSESVRSCRLTDSDFIRATDGVIGRFQSALRFKTISTNLHQYDRAELQKMVDFVQSGDTICCLEGLQIRRAMTVKIKLEKNFVKYFFMNGVPACMFNTIWLLMISTAMETNERCQNGKYRNNLHSICIN